MKVKHNGHEYEFYVDMNTLENYTGNINTYLKDLSAFQQDLISRVGMASSLVQKYGDKYYFVPPLAIDSTKCAPGLDNKTSVFNSYVPTSCAILLPGGCGGSKHGTTEDDRALTVADMSERYIKFTKDGGSTSKIDLIDRDPWDAPHQNTEFNKVLWHVKVTSKSKDKVKIKNWRDGKRKESDATAQDIFFGNCVALGSFTTWDEKYWKKCSQTLRVPKDMAKHDHTSSVKTYFFKGSIRGKLAKLLPARVPPHIQELKAADYNFIGTNTVVMPLNAYTLDPNAAVSAHQDWGMTCFQVFTNPVATIFGNAGVKKPVKDWDNFEEMDYWANKKLVMNECLCPILQKAQIEPYEIDDYLTGQTKSEQWMLFPMFALTGFASTVYNGFLSVESTTIILPEFLKPARDIRKDITSCTTGECIRLFLDLTGKPNFKAVCGIDTAAATITYRQQEFVATDKVKRIAAAIKESIDSKMKYWKAENRAAAEIIWGSFFGQIAFKRMYPNVAMACYRYFEIDSAIVRKAVEDDFIKNKDRYDYKVDGMTKEEYAEKAKEELGKTLATTKNARGPKLGTFKVPMGPK